MKAKVKENTRKNYKNFRKIVDKLERMYYYNNVKKRRSYPLLTLSYWKKVNKYSILKESLRYIYVSLVD